MILVPLVMVAALHGSYTVKPGDTLSAIAEETLDNANAWPTIYDENRAVIGSNPNLIFPGEVYEISGSGASTDASVASNPPREAVSPTVSDLSGTLSCAGLESLWESAGGPEWAALTAASIAMAESSGEQYATGPYGERGYWQINPVNGSLSTYDAYGNARAAVILSDGGTNFSPWTTYTDGAYYGRCL